MIERISTLAGLLTIYADFVVWYQFIYFLSLKKNNYYNSLYDMIPLVIFEYNP